MSQIKVTQMRGLSGSTERQRQTVKGLGLRRRHHTVTLQATPSIRGMIAKVSHLVKVEDETEG